MTTHHLLGTLRPAARHIAVRVEDRYATGIEDLWSAVTDPDRLARWVAVIEGDLRPGGTIQTSFTSGWAGPGRIDVCDAPHRLVVTMSPGADDETVIEALLTPDGDGTRLVIEERGIPATEAPGHGAGWQVHLEDLAAYLAGRATSDWQTRWQELIAAYDDQGITR